MCILLYQKIIKVLVEAVLHIFFYFNTVFFSCYCVYLPPQINKYLNNQAPPTPLYITPQASCIRSGRCGSKASITDQRLLQRTDYDDYDEQIFQKRILVHHSISGYVRVMLYHLCHDHVWEIFFKYQYFLQCLNSSLQYVWGFWTVTYVLGKLHSHQKKKQLNPGLSFKCA